MQPALHCRIHRHCYKHSLLCCDGTVNRYDALHAGGAIYLDGTGLDRSGRWCDGTKKLDVTNGLSHYHDWSVVHVSHTRHTLAKWQVAPTFFLTQIVMIRQEWLHPVMLILKHLWLRLHHETKFVEPV